MTRISDNKLSLGLFGANCSGGLAASTFDDRWDASWDNNLALAQAADAAGLDFMLPLGRWKGYGGETDHNGSAFETLTWASGLLAATQRIRVFGTLHVTLVNPVFAAKQMVTASHIGKGRFGLNIVCGWNQDEFDMLGVDLGDHDRRYDYGQEWVDLLTRTWTSDEAFDFAGEFFNTHGTLQKPRPWVPEDGHSGAAARPMLVSAAMSGRGREFALNNADVLFTVTFDINDVAGQIDQLRADAAALGREVGIFTNCYVVCRPTQKEAEDYHRHYAVERADTEAVKYMVKGRGMDERDMPDAFRDIVYMRCAGGNSGMPIVGDPDRVAEIMKTLSDGGLDALAIGLPNYLKELPYFEAEVLPRLKDMGLRA